MHMTEVETHKARKAHRCEWCWQRIDEGAEYKRYRYYDGGEAATIRMHPECMGAMQDEAAEWGGDFEWTPGQERPKVGAGETAVQGDMLLTANAELTGPQQREEEHGN